MVGEKTEEKKCVKKACAKKPAAKKADAKKYQLELDKEKNKWKLKAIGATRAIGYYNTKEEATKKLNSLLAKNASATATVRKADGKFQKHDSASVNKPAEKKEPAKKPAAKKACAKKTAEKKPAAKKTAAKKPAAKKTAEKKPDEVKPAEMTV